MAFPSLRVLNSSHTQLGNGDSWKAPFRRLLKTEAWQWQRSLVSFGFLDVNDAEQGGIVCDTLFWLQEQLAARLRKPSKLALAHEILGGECGGSVVEGCFTCFNYFSCLLGFKWTLQTVYKLAALLFIYYLTLKCATGRLFRNRKFAVRLWALVKPNAIQKKKKKQPASGNTVVINFLLKTQKYF